LPTNRRFLAACLRHPEFRAGRALIPFLNEHADGLRAAMQEEEQQAAASFALAALLCHADPGERRLACPFPRPLRVRHRERLLALRVRELSGGALEVEQGGQSRIVKPPAVTSAPLDDNRWHVQAGALDLFLQDASFEPAAQGAGAAGLLELRAPFNGKVISVQALPGTVVSRGDTLLVLESMKLEHVLGASRSGVIKAVHVEPGQQAVTSQVLVTFEAAA
jgi:geranyl-CoA carboxylase alpha subunit